MASKEKPHSPPGEQKFAQCRLSDDMIMQKYVKKPPLLANNSNYRELAKTIRTKHHIEIGVLIGCGGCAVVAKAAYHGTGNVVATKIIDSRGSTEYIKRYLPREIDVVRQLVHPNIVKVHEILHVDPYIVLVLDYCSGGDLLMKIQHEKRLDENEAKFLFRQIVEALMYMQYKKVVHRDIKCENIFLDQYQNAKIGDFGFAKFMQVNETAKSLCGSPAYVAPEIVGSINYSGYATDVWSTGVVLYAMLTGVLPFAGLDATLNPKPKLSFPANYPSAEARKVIEHMLQHDPKDRIVVHNICGLPWLNSYKYSMRNGEK